MSSISRDPAPLDMLVVGGGINGAGIARDAAGRGLSVMLVEQDDLASHTSSASTKLIHGGLRYLEQGAFRLVRESLQERELLWRMAPHIIRPMRFVLPQTHSPRPAWLVRLGLFLYDHLGGREKLPGTETVGLAGSPAGNGLRDRRGKAFVYSDCAVDDSRLVVLNALDARERGADIRTRTRLVAARREGPVWRATIEGAGEQVVHARILVNAAGPWVKEVIGRAGAGSARQLRLVKGSHLVVPRLYDGDHAFMLQNVDRRILFAIPYQDAFTLLGTTDEPFDGAPARTAISAAETRYILDAANLYFERRISEADIVWSYSGIRPLYDDKAGNASAVTRDYVLDLDSGSGAGEAPLLSVFGGKITTYRKLAEHALAELARFIPGAGGAWTADAVLPGGDIQGGDFEAFLREIAVDYPGVGPALLRRLASAYGTRARAILGTAKDGASLGCDVGGGLHEAEIDYLCAEEWARTADDLLFRRSKLGLRLSPDRFARIDAYLASRAGAAPRA
jgi:glycerol-3-phosphate dehydrogenase